MARIHDVAVRARQQDRVRHTSEIKPVAEPSIATSRAQNNSPKLNSRSEWLQWIMVLFVLVATIFMAIKNDKYEIVFNLCTLCFGFYFGAQNRHEPPRAA